MERNRLDRKRKPSGAAVMRGELTDALLRALFREWAERGYAALSLEAVAKRAGAGKAALYRRWPSKTALARDALDQVGLDLTAVADQGSLWRDIRAMLGALRLVLRHPLARRIIPDLHAEIARSAEVAAMVRPFQSARRLRGEDLIRRAIERGELPAEVDVQLANDLLAAPLYWRLVVVPGRVDGAYLDRLATAIEAGLRSLK